MAETRRRTLGEILAPWRTRFAIGVPLAAGTYQFACDQFGAPTLPVLWGMTAPLIPWWGWLLIAQAGFVYALFEYVRRFAGQGGQSTAAASYDDSELRTMVLEIKGRQQQIIDDYQRMLALEERFDNALDELSNRITVVDAKYAGEVVGLKGTVTKRFDSIHQSFLAVFYRERLLKLAEMIAERSEWLYARIEGDKSGDLTVIEWDHWQAEEKAWRSDISEWCLSASYYRPDAAAEIERPDKHRYKMGPWDFREDQFPTHEGNPLLRSGAVDQYKLYRIADGRWSDLKEEVHTVVRKVAFEGLWLPHWN